MVMNMRIRVGDAPFGELRSADVRAQLKGGYRMSCPDDCHPDL